MALDTYTGLLSALAAFSVRSDQTALWPACVALAEAQMNRALGGKEGQPIRPMVGRSDATLDEEFESAPPDMIRPLSFTLLGDPPIELAHTSAKNLHALKARKDHSRCVYVNDVEAPAWYAHVGTEFQVYPAPTTSLSAELTYVKRIPALSDDNPTNWLLTSHPDVYLYGALVQFAMTSEDERMGAWSSAYAAALDGVKAAYPTETDKRTLRTEVPRSCRY